MKNRMKKAAAIQYSPEEGAPKVIAKGKGIIADKIVERGVGNEIPIYEDSELADMLTKLNIGDQIPPELYEVVAQILIFVSDLDALEGKVHGFKKQP